MNKKDGRQQNGHRLGWVSAPMWARMQKYCEAFAITANDLTVRAIDSFLLEWEEEITEDTEMSKRNDTIYECPVCGYEFPVEDGVRDEVIEEDGYWMAVEYLPNGGRYIHHEHKLPQD